VPMEVMGLMLGEFVDEYTVRVVNVFAMPQSGTGVSVEAVDHVFQICLICSSRREGISCICDRGFSVLSWYCFGLKKIWDFVIKLTYDANRI